MSLLTIIKLMNSFRVISKRQLFSFPQSRNSSIKIPNDLEKASIDAFKRFNRICLRELKFIEFYFQSRPSNEEIHNARDKKPPKLQFEKFLNYLTKSVTVGCARGNWKKKLQCQCQSWKITLHWTKWYAKTRFL